MTTAALLVLQAKGKLCLQFVLDLDTCETMEDVKKLREKYLAMANSMDVSVPQQ